MYKTKQMSYNTKEKPMWGCTNEYLSEKKECYQNWLYQITLRVVTEKYFQWNKM